MPRPSFTVEQAREAGKRSAELRAQRKLNPPIEPPSIVPEASLDAEPTLSQYANKLAYAQDRLLDELLAADSPKDKAALSQALKNLKESWHMETGAPKPGTIKPERQSSRQQIKPASEPKLDTPTGGSPGA